MTQSKSLTKILRFDIGKLLWLILYVFIQQSDCNNFMLPRVELKAIRTKLIFRWIKMTEKTIANNFG